MVNFRDKKQNDYTDNDSNKCKKKENSCQRNKISAAILLMRYEIRITNHLITYITVVNRWYIWYTHTHTLTGTFIRRSWKQLLIFFIGKPFILHAINFQTTFCCCRCCCFRICLFFWLIKSRGENPIFMVMTILMAILFQWLISMLVGWLKLICLTKFCGLNVAMCSISNVHAIG